MALVKIGLIIVFLIAFTAMGIGTVSAVAVLNPANGHYYELVADSNINWSAARDAASGMTLDGDLCNGYLTTITSQEENDFIVATFGKGALHHKWIGAFQDTQYSATVNDGWQWITGEPWNYTNWNPSEPNNLGYPDYGYEDAVTYWNNGNDGKWNDAPSEWDKYLDGGYVVEYNCMQIAIDIKPGSYPNSINNNGKGVIPVAILTTDVFDASTVDPSTITLDGATPRVNGRSGTIGSLQDVDNDGDLDLVVQIQDVAGTYSVGDTVGSLYAMTDSGGNVMGQDSIRIVPPA
jgi:hypothetical protein